jgi:integrase
MPISKDKKTGQRRFEFNRIIANRRIRATKLLPKSWSAKQADDYDKKETARLYASETGEIDTPSIEQAVLIYLQERAPNLKTFKAVQKQLEQDFKHYQGKLISELPEVANTIRKLDIAEASKRNHIAVIRAACRYAWKYHKLGTYDPAQHVAMPKVRNERQVYASRKQMLQIALKCSRKVRPLIRIAFYSGMRLGEIIKAQVQDGCFVLLDTKNNEPRVIPIHLRLNTTLKHLPPKVAKSTIQDHFRTARKKAKLTHINFHDLRHSTASEMINNGVDLYTVGAVLGHKDPRSTKRYSHLQTKTLRIAIDKVGR